MTDEVPTLQLGSMDAAIELLQEGLARVLENIDDPNTDAKATREIILRYKFKVEEDRRVGDIIVTSTQKLASVRARKTPVVFGRRRGVLVVIEQPSQDSLFQESEARPRLVKDGGA